MWECKNLWYLILSPTYYFKLFLIVLVASGLLLLLFLRHLRVSQVLTDDEPLPPPPPPFYSVPASSQNMVNILSTPAACLVFGRFSETLKETEHHESVSNSELWSRLLVQTGTVRLHILRAVSGYRAMWHHQERLRNAGKIAGRSPRWLRLKQAQQWWGWVASG